MEAATRRLGAWQERRFRDEALRLERLAARLEPANVAKLLGRGFALVVKDGHLVTRSARLATDDAVRIALAEGWVDARVTSRDAGEDPLPGRRPEGDAGAAGPPLTPPSGVVK
jgi:exodeoxyribonuclease VII large subunit